MEEFTDLERVARLASTCRWSMECSVSDDGRSYLVRVNNGNEVVFMGCGGCLQSAASKCLTDMKDAVGKLLA